jgi:hypothetical protein
VWLSASSTSLRETAGSARAAPRWSFNSIGMTVVPPPIGKRSSGTISFKRERRGALALPLEESERQRKMSEQFPTSSVAHHCHVFLRTPGVGAVVLMRLMQPARFGSGVRCCFSSHVHVRGVWLYLVGSEQGGARLAPRCSILTRSTSTSHTVSTCGPAIGFVICRPSRIEEVST